jgi:hypothetical protein
MSPFADHLPNRFPVGTRYIIEGRGGGDGRLRVHLRCLQFPDGRQLSLPVEGHLDPPRKRRRRSQRAAARE